MSVTAHGAVHRVACCRVFVYRLEASADEVRKLGQWVEQPEWDWEGGCFECM